MTKNFFKNHDYMIIRKKYLKFFSGFSGKRIKGPVFIRGRGHRGRTLGLVVKGAGVIIAGYRAVF